MERRKDNNRHNEDNYLKAATDLIKKGEGDFVPTLRPDPGDGSAMMGYGQNFKTLKEYLDHPLKRYVKDESTGQVREATKDELTADYNAFKTDPNHYKGKVFTTEPASSAAVEESVQKRKSVVEATKNNPNYFGKMTPGEFAVYMDQNYNIANPENAGRAMPQYESAYEAGDKAKMLQQSMTGSAEPFSKNDQKYSKLITRDNERRNKLRTEAFIGKKQGTTEFERTYNTLQYKRDQDWNQRRDELKEKYKDDPDAINKLNKTQSPYKVNPAYRPQKDPTSEVGDVLQPQTLDQVLKDVEGSHADDYFEALKKGVDNAKQARESIKGNFHDDPKQVASLDDAIGFSSPKKERPLPSSRFVGVVNEETGELEKHPKFDELMQKNAPMTDEEKKDLAELFHINMNVGMGNYPKEDIDNEHDNGFTYKDALVRLFGYARDKNGKANTMVLMPKDDPDFKPRGQPSVPVPRTRLEAVLSGVEGFAEAMNKPVKMNIQDTLARDPGSIAATKMSPVRDDNNGLGKALSDLAKAFNPYALDNPELEPDEAKSVYDSTFGKGADKSIYDSLADKTNPYRPRLMKNKQRLSQMAYGPRRPSLSGSFGSAPGQGLL